MYLVVSGGDYGLYAIVQVKLIPMWYSTTYEDTYEPTASNKTTNKKNPHGNYMLKHNYM